VYVCTYCVRTLLYTDTHIKEIVLKAYGLLKKSIKTFYLCSRRDIGFAWRHNAVVGGLECLQICTHSVYTQFILDPNLWNTAKSLLIADISIRRVIGLAWRHKGAVGAVLVFVCILPMHLYNTIHEIYYNHYKY